MTNKSLPAFVIDPSPTICWPVTVELPGNGGRLVKQCFNATFRVLSEKEVRAIIESGKSGKPEGERTVADIEQENATIYRQIVTGWDVTDAAGQPVPLSQLPDLLTDSPYSIALAKGLQAAWLQMRFGQAPEDGGVIEGNSVPSPAAGSETVAQAMTN